VDKCGKTVDKLGWMWKIGDKCSNYSALASKSAPHIWGGKCPGLPYIKNPAL